MSKGIFQFDMGSHTNFRDLDKLRNSVKEQDSIPLGTTCQSIDKSNGNNECFEPLQVIYSRRTLAGEFVVINKYLMKELEFGSME